VSIGFSHNKLLGKFVVKQLVGFSFQLMLVRVPKDSAVEN